VMINLGDYEFSVLNFELEDQIQNSKFKIQNSVPLADRWILSRFHQVTQQTRTAIDSFALGEAAKGLYEFFWGDFCDLYIELVKSRLLGDNAESKQSAQQVLAFVLDGILKLLHPFMPHITEELWQTLTGSGTTPPDTLHTLALQPYPEVDLTLIDTDLEQQFTLITDTIRTIRNLRAEADIKPGVKIRAILQSESDRERQILTAGQSSIQDLAKIETLTIQHPTESDPAIATEKMVAGVTGTVQILIPLSGVVDMDALRAKLDRDLKKIEAEIQALSGRLNNPSFVNKAPAEVVQTAQAALTEAQKQAEILQNRLREL